MIDLNHVRYLVDEEGHPTAAVIDIAQWEALLEMLDDASDVELAIERLGSWKARTGWTPWEVVEAEMDGA